TRLDGTAVHFDQAAYQGEPDAEPSLSPAVCAVPLGEQVEHLGQHVGRDAHAVVPHGQDGIRAVAPGREPDVAPRLGVLRGVVEQVGNDLRETYRIGVQDQRVGWKVHDELVPGGIDQRCARFQRAADDGGELARLLAQGDLATSDARHLHQVVHQSHQVVDLPLHHLVDARGGSAVGHSQEVQAVPD